MSVKEISEDIYYGTDTIITTTKEVVEPKPTSNAKWVNWGENNNYPAEVLDLVKDETTSSGNLSFKEAAHYGSGLLFYKRKYEDNKEIITPIDIDQEAEINELYIQVKDFIFRNDIENYLQGLITDYENFNSCATEFISDGTQKSILTINRKPIRKIRKQPQNAEEKIDNYFYSSKWPTPKEDEYEMVLALRKDNVANYIENNFTQTTMYISERVNADRDYNPSPYWHSSMKFMGLAVKVSTWMISNLDNAANIKYHIEIPESYFNKLHPEERYGEDKGGEEARQKAIKSSREALYSQINEVLAGAKNASKIFYTQFAVDPVDPSKSYPGFKINVLDNKVQDAAFIVTYETAASAISTAHNVAKELSGLVGPKGLSAGSGSNIREQLNLYTGIHTVIPRQTTLEALYMVKHINKWPSELHFGYKDLVLQTLDKNPTGGQNVITDNGTPS